MKFRRREQPQFISDMAEYKALGAELKNTTRDKLAEKFGVSHCGLAVISQLTIGDFALIKALIKDRNETMVKRKHLRLMIAR